MMKVWVSLKSTSHFESVQQIFVWLEEVTMARWASDGGYEYEETEVPISCVVNHDQNGTYLKAQDIHSLGLHI